MKSKHSTSNSFYGHGHDIHTVNFRNFAISRGFYFHETSHMRSFAKIKPSGKQPNLQYCEFLNSHCEFRNFHKGFIFREAL